LAPDINNQGYHSTETVKSKMRLGWSTVYQSRGMKVEPSLSFMRGFVLKANTAIYMNSCRSVEPYFVWSFSAVYEGREARCTRPEVVKWVEMCYSLQCIEFLKMSLCYISRCSNEQW
jgi:hypothetical protein